MTQVEFAVEGILTIKSLFKFCREASKSILPKEVAELYAKNRRCRRPYFAGIAENQTNAEQYFKLVCAFDNDVQFLI